MGQGDVVQSAQGFSEPPTKSEQGRHALLFGSARSHVSRSGLQFPKPEPKKTEKRRQKTHRNAVIAAVRASVVSRDTQCRLCHGMFAGGEFAPEMHELVPRSKLGGRAPEEVFNRHNCLLLHRACHRDVTERRVTLTPADPDLGADGIVHVQKIRKSPVTT